MRRELRPLRFGAARRPVVAGALVAGLLAVFAYGWSQAGTSEEKKAASWSPVFPPNRSAIFYCNFDLICKAEPGKLLVDGKPHAWESFRSPLRVAHLGLEPGMHRLEIDGHRVEVFISLGPDERDWPSTWPTYRSHEMEIGAGRCGVCHRTTKEAGQIAVGEWKGHEACMECHTRAELDATHCHWHEPLQGCPSCHSIHGATQKSLLRAPVKKLCSQCHDA